MQTGEGFEILSTVITDVLIFGSSDNAPPDYSIVKKTTDYSDADLLQETTLFKRNCRYLGFKIDNYPTPLTKVLSDLRLIPDSDTIPLGFSPIPMFRERSNEKPLRKRYFVGKYEQLQKCETVIQSIFVLSSKKCPTHARIIGDVGNKFVAVTSGKASKYMPQNLQQEKSQQNIPNSDTFYAFATNRRQNAHPLFGVPIQISLKSSSNNLSLPDSIQTLAIRNRSLMEINDLYSYNFAIERSIIDVG